VVAGLDLAETAFKSLDPDVRFTRVVADGGKVAAGGTIAKVAGSTRALLTGERTALNFLGRLSGIATLTASYVAEVEGTAAKIAETRKTTPGLRALEKYAVRCGGGTNHRMGLDDAILIKDNHVRIAGGIEPALAAVRAAGSGLTVEIEADTLDQVEQALAAGAARILLDNMSPAEAARAVELVQGRALLEASGGIDQDSVRTYAETGVDFISIGALTHGARSLHVSLEVT
jgi:nicotinate-nucleotide pyrophosphorylase (carboxylating)